MYTVIFEKDAEKDYNERLIPIGGRHLENVYHALEDIFARDPFRGIIIENSNPPCFVIRSIPSVFNGVPEISVTYAFIEQEGRIEILGIIIHSVSA